MRRLLVFLVGLLPALALAQPIDSGIDTEPRVTRLGQSEQTVSTAPGYYRHHLPGEATIQVQVEGAVLSPGLYEIADETDLRQLIALAGGPQIDVRDRDSDRRVEIEVIRPGHGLVYGALLADASAHPERIPDLLHHDAVYVEVIDKRRFTVRDAIAIAGSGGTIAFLVQLLFR